MEQGQKTTENGSWFKIPVVIVAGAVVDLPVAVEDLLVPVGEGAALALDLLDSNTKYYRWDDS